ncbi:Conserved_hypothetical protein [Hexamita inflata]|uniref:Uncharacterized protein n=1 Tax=Hexamita inflata TaxID=28002 RepID=A0AA86NI72_9EUKA|nr:Conserved hypothetical protein [Hexamita inflata]
MSSLESFENQLDEFKTFIINSRNTQVTAVMYLKENGDIEGPKSTYMATYLLEQRLEYAMTAISNCRIRQGQLNAIMKNIATYTQQLSRLQQCISSSTESERYIVLQSVQNFFKTQRIRHQLIYNYNSFLKGDNAFQSAICDILKLKQVKRYEGEYLFRINSKLELIGPAYRQTGEPRYIYDKRVFVHKSVEYLFTYDRDACVKYDWLSSQYCTFQGLLKEKDARMFSLYLTDSIQNVQQVYDQFYSNIDFIREKLKSGIKTEQTDLYKSEQYLPTFDELFHELESSDGVRERSQSILEQDVLVYSEEYSQKPRSRRNSISKIQQAAVVQTINQFPPLFGQLFEQLIEYFFGAQFPLLNQFNELKKVIEQVNSVYCSEILQQVLDNDEPTTIQELATQLFYNYEKFTVFCKEVLGITWEQFDPHNLAKIDMKQRQIEHVKQQIKSLNEKQTETQEAINSLKINIEEMCDQIMMSCDYMDMEIQNGGCQASLVCNGLEEEPDRDW